MMHLPPPLPPPRRAFWLVRRPAARPHAPLLAGLPRLVALAALLLTRPALAQQPDTIRVGDKRLHAARLQPGTRQYLVYFVNPAKPKNVGFWLWRRELQASQHQGQPVWRVQQHWYGSDSTSYREITSLVRADDFAPLYHDETVRGQRKAYNWHPQRVSGADSVSHNQAAAFQLVLPQPVFNWNLDIETFELLPLAAGKRFVIPFYDAGSPAPTYAEYTVTGRESLRLPGGQTVPCWKLVTEGRTPAGAPYKQTFWLSQRGQEFLKEEDQYPGGLFRYKIKTTAVPEQWLGRPAGPAR